MSEPEQNPESERPSETPARRPWVAPTLVSRPLYEQLATTCPLRFQTGKPS
jgi:hypothetical protein